MAETGMAEMGMSTVGGATTPVACRNAGRTQRQNNDGACENEDAGTTYQGLAPGFEPQSGFAGERKVLSFEVGASQLGQE